MMPKHSSRAPWGRRFTAMIAVSLLTLGACSDSDGGGVGPSSIETVGIVTLPNNQTLTNLTPGDKRKILGVPTNSKGNFIDKPVTLASSNPAIFTIVGDSIVTQVGGGTAYLRATAGGRTDSVAIGVRYRVASITLTPAAPTIRREAAQQITAVVRDGAPVPAIVTGRTVNWTSSNTAVATVSATGLVSATATAVDGSTTTITATAPNTLDGAVATVASVVVTVSGDAVVSSVVVTSAAGADNAIGFRGNVGTVQMNAAPRSGLGNPVAATIAWSSNAASVATVNSTTGLVTFAGGSGPVTITATAVAGGAGGANVAGTAAFTVAPTLISGVTQTGAMAAGAGVDYAYSASRVGASSFTAVTSGGSGDGDLYVFNPGVTNGTTSDAGGSNFLCRSWNSGNGESCPVLTVAAGWYRLRLHAWTPAGAVAGMQLTLTETLAP
jgi:uncharacterized protein YjdB